MVSDSFALLVGLQLHSVGNGNIGEVFRVEDNLVATKCLCVRPAVCPSVRPSVYPFIHPLVPGPPREHKANLFLLQFQSGPFFVVFLYFFCVNFQ